MNKTYVVDTNVLLSDPNCIVKLRNGEENKVIIPYHVLSELDRLKQNSSKRYMVSKAIDQIIENKDIIHIPIDRNKIASDSFSDSRSLIEILDSDEMKDAILVSNDKIYRLIASLVGIQSEEYKDINPFKSESETYTGFSEDGSIPNSFNWDEGKPVYHSNKGPKVIDYDMTVWGITPNTIYQKLAFVLMKDPDIDVISIQSEAGKGKNTIAQAMAMYLTLEKKKFDKIYIFKSNIEIGEKIGYLPGDVNEKMSLFSRPIQETFIRLHKLRPANKIFLNPEVPRKGFNENMVEILPINFLRGWDICDSFVIIDEVQNFTKDQVGTILKRMASGTKIVFLGDVNQVDNPHLDRNNNGMNWLLVKAKGQPNYAHIVLGGNRTRGPIASMAIRIGL
jgi:PhoH-like ATPase